MHDSCILEIGHRMWSIAAFAEKKLYSHCLEIHYQQELWKRSIFCMTDVYNRLPQHVVDIPNVSNFQTALTHIARTACQNGNAEWQSTFSSR